MQYFKNQLFDVALIYKKNLKQYKKFILLRGVWIAKKNNMARPIKQKQKTTTIKNIRLKANERERDMNEIWNFFLHIISLSKESSLRS